MVSWSSWFHSLLCCCCEGIAINWIVMCRFVVQYIIFFSRYSIQSCTWQQLNGVQKWLGSVESWPKALAFAMESQATRWLFFIFISTQRILYTCIEHVNLPKLSWTIGRTNSALLIGPYLSSKGQLESSFSCWICWIQRNRHSLAIRSSRLEKNNGNDRNLGLVLVFLLHQYP